MDAPSLDDVYLNISGWGWRVLQPKKHPKIAQRKSWKLCWGVWNTWWSTHRCPNACAILHLSAIRCA